jgi:hypothetical protein
MKNLILFLLIFTSVMSSYSQTVEYNKYPDTKLHKYISYVSKSGDIINIGDTLIIGKPSGIKTFNFIQQGMEFCAPHISGKQVIVTGIRSYKNNLFIEFKGYGLVPVYIQYENAIDTKEIGLNIKYTSSEALTILKENKEKLDLQLITQEEYNKKKEELSKYIK